MFAFTHLSNNELEIPLHSAATSGCPKTIRHLLRRFPNSVNHGNRDGETPAMYAAGKDKTEAFQLLFKADKERLQVQGNSVKNAKTWLEWAVINKVSQASIILDRNDWKAVGKKP